MGDSPDLFVPMMMKPEVTPGWNDLDKHRSRWLNIIARLKPGESVATAEAGLEPLWKALRQEELKEIHDHSDKFIERFVSQVEDLVARCAAADSRPYATRYALRCSSSWAWSCW